MATGAGMRHMLTLRLRALLAYEQYDALREAVGRVFSVPPAAVGEPREVFEPLPTVRFDVPFVTAAPVGDARARLEVLPRLLPAGVVAESPIYLDGVAYPVPAAPPPRARPAARPPPAAAPGVATIPARPGGRARARFAPYETPGPGAAPTPTPARPPGTPRRQRPPAGRMAEPIVPPAMPPLPPATLRTRCYDAVAHPEFVAGRTDVVCASTALLQRVAVALGYAGFKTLRRDTLVAWVRDELGADQRAWPYLLERRLPNDPDAAALAVELDMATMPQLSRAAAALDPLSIAHALQRFAFDESLALAFYGAVVASDEPPRPPFTSPRLRPPARAADPPWPQFVPPGPDAAPPRRFAVVLNTVGAAELAREPSGRTVEGHWVAAFVDAEPWARQGGGGPPPLIEYMDSVAVPLAARPQVSAALRAFADALYDDYGVPVDRERVREFTQPKQRFGEECGVYVVDFVARRALGEPFESVDAAPLPDEACRELRGHYWTLV